MEKASLEDVYDVVIIGGGPAGLSAAIYAARSKLRTVVLDKNPKAGALGSAARIENYPGVPRTLKGSELLSLFRSQARSFGAETVQTKVFYVDFEKNPKEVMTERQPYRGKVVIIASGAMGRKPSIRGEAELIGKGVSYCATCDAAFFRGEPVAMVGAVDEILEEFDSVARFAGKIYLLPYAREIPPEQEEILRSHPNVEWLPERRVLEIKGQTAVKGLVISDPELGERFLDLTGVFLYLHGNQPIVDFLSEAVEITPEGCIKVDKEDMSTSVEGVFAIGDVTCKKIRQSILAAAEGCLAALAAEKYINKRQRIRPQWS